MGLARLRTLAIVCGKRLKQIQTTSICAHKEGLSALVAGVGQFREKFVQNVQKKFENLCKITLDKAGKRRRATIVAPTSTLCRFKALKLAIFHKKSLFFNDFLCILTKK